jgi:hypothetical protein
LASPTSWNNHRAPTRRPMKKRLQLHKPQDAGTNPSWSFPFG